MAGVPGWIEQGPGWALFAFLFVVVFVRAQGTYWAARWVRSGAMRAESDEPGRRGRMSRRLSGPAMERAQGFLDRWGYLGVPLSFLTIGFQTMVNAAAGFGRMRWDLYTVAMLPGCAAWATMYALLGLSLIQAWSRSPWLVLAIIAGIIALAWGATALRRNAGSGARTPQ